MVAWKPFSSGGLEDAAFLKSLMSHADGIARNLSLEKINPFAFSAPITPLLAARLEHVRVNLPEVSSRLRGFDGLADVILVEGAGGLLSPLGEGFSALDLIREWECRVLVVAPNRLGVINHLRLTMGALQSGGVRRMTTALIEPMIADDATAGNADLLRELLPDVPLVRIPHLTNGLMSPETIRESVPNLDIQLGQLLGALLDPA